jgi:hypothetical protein
MVLPCCGVLERAKNGHTTSLTLPNHTTAFAKESKLHPVVASKTPRCEQESCEKAPSSSSSEAALTPILQFCKPKGCHRHRRQAVAVDSQSLEHSRTIDTVGSRPLNHSLTLLTRATAAQLCGGTSPCVTCHAKALVQVRRAPSFARLPACLSHSSHACLPACLPLTWRPLSSPNWHSLSLSAQVQPSRNTAVHPYS